MSIDPDAFRPLPLGDERAAAARAEAETVLAEANRLHSEAQQDAERIVSSARTEASAVVSRARQEAQRLQNEAKAEQERRQKRDDNLDTWAARAVIAGAVGLTASGEYSLARMAGFTPNVAWLLPFVIDVYVIQAFRRHRDIVQAIALTIGANVTYHLAEAGLFGVTARREPTWWLIALVASVASLILWRMHLMVRPAKAAKTPRQRRQEDRQETPDAPPTPAPEPAAAAANTADKNERQEPPTGAANERQNEPANTAPSVDKKPAQPRRQNTAKSTAKKAASKRRSMDEWVGDAGPVFHAEFARLRRNPTASEFAAAIQKAGLGKVSDSTAKNIRAEILDRAELPSLEDTE